MVEHAANKTNTLPFAFYVANAAANGSNVNMSAAGEATATDVAQQPCPWAGSIVGLSIQVEAECSAGTLTVQPTINGSAAATSLSFEQTTNTQYQYSTWRRDLYPVTAGQRIGCLYTTSTDWAAGTTPSVRAVVYVHVESM